MSKISEVIAKIRFYWHLTSKTFQKIFLYLQWFNKTYIHTFPSLDTIASACKCNRRTVSRALSYFETHHWITRLKRAYQSNIYILHPDLVSFDCFDDNNFKRDDVPQVVPVNVPVNVPVLENTNPSIYFGTGTEAVPDIESKNLAKPKIHECIRRFRLTDEEKIRLTNNFTEYHLANAIDDGKWLEQQGGKIKTLMGFLWARAAACKNSYKKAY